MRILQPTAAVFLVLLYWGCDRKADIRQSTAQTDTLTAVRQQLKELQIQLAEKDLTIRQLQQDLDSLQGDTLKLGLYNPQLIGQWLVNMKCTETSCDGSAVGDSRSELWQLSYLDESIVVKVLSNGKVVRTYKGIYTRKGLRLEDEANRQEATIVVAMFPPVSGKMEGQRTISQANCRIVYAVSAEKAGTSNSKL